MLEPSWLDAIIGGVLGLLIGSFLNVVVYRTPVMMYRGWLRDSAGSLKAADPEHGVQTSLWDLVFQGRQPPPHLYASAAAAGQALDELPAFNLLRPRSRCGHCGHAVRWFENIPVLSWLVLRGKCSACKKTISPRYPLVELTTGLLFAVCSWRWGLTPMAAAWAALAALLVAQFLIDFDTQFLPDTLNYLILWGGLIATALGWTGISLPSSMWGAVFGYLSLWTVYQLHRALTGKEGMGHGDFKLLAALGAWFGAHYLLALILMSTLVGSILGGALLVVGRLAHRDMPISFGPFLAGAGLLVLVLGPGTVQAWLPFAFPFSQPPH
jgi:leader peptidase (prepilin peptidase)/N-methyltransferase